MTEIPVPTDDHGAVARDTAAAILRAALAMGLNDRRCGWRRCRTYVSTGVPNPDWRHVAVAGWLVRTVAARRHMPADSRDGCDEVADNLLAEMRRAMFHSATDPLTDSYHDAVHTLLSVAGQPDPRSAVAMAQTLTEGRTTYFATDILEQAAHAVAAITTDWSTSSRIARIGALMDRLRAATDAAADEARERNA